MVVVAYNIKNQAQFNTVIVQQEKVDWVGFEPTTSAGFWTAYSLSKDMQLGKESLAILSHELVLSKAFFHPSISVSKVASCSSNCLSFKPSGLMNVQEAVEPCWLGTIRT